MRRLVLGLAAGALFLMSAASAASAGGWAVTTFDSLPPEFRAGETYQLGYTIRQHGQTPVNVDRTEIVIWRGDAQADRQVFDGMRQGDVGHYVARVTFPASGEWSWEVQQGPFPAQPLGKLQIQPGLGAQRDAAPQVFVAPAPAPIQSQPLFAAAAGFFAAIFLWRAMVLVRLLRGRAAAS
jgi:hypothetical protein